MHVLDKETLRDQLVTERNINKQLRHDFGVKERCYQTVMRQRDEAEEKLKSLILFVDDDLMLNSHQREIANKLLNKIEEI